MPPAGVAFRVQCSSAAVTARHLLASRGVPKHLHEGAPHRLGCLSVPRSGGVRHCSTPMHTYVNVSKHVYIHTFMHEEKRWSTVTRRPEGRRQTPQAANSPHVIHPLGVLGSKYYLAAARGSPDLRVCGTSWRWSNFIYYLEANVRCGSVGLY